MLKKLTLVGILMLLCIPVFVGCGQKNDNTIKVAIDIQNEPYAFQQIIDLQSAKQGGGASFSHSDRVKNAYTGFEVELIQSIAAKEGFKLDFVEMPWINILSTVKNGECDIAIGDISVTDQRVKDVSFSLPYISDANTVIVVKKDSDIKTVNDLSGKLIAVEIGTTFPGKLMQLDNAKIRGYLGTAEANRDFLSGNVNAILMDAYQFRYLHRNNKFLNTKAIPLGDNESIAMAISKDKPELLKKINKALAEMEANGELAELKHKWFCDDDV